MSPEKWFVGAIALIRRPGSAGRDEWLALWHEARRCYHFVEARKLEDESFRDSLEREIAWATGLKSGRDYIVSGGPRAHLQFVGGNGGDGPEGGEQEGYVVEFYLVELMGRHHAEILGGESLQWIGAQSLRTGQTPDGRPICPQLLALLKKGDLIPK